MKLYSTVVNNAIHNRGMVFELHKTDWHFLTQNINVPKKLIRYKEK